MRQPKPNQISAGLRKYIYGPGIDQPVDSTSSPQACMIEVADSNAAYYYHFDGLGSVVALSDSSGDTVQTYEYSVFGQPAVENIDHPNPYMFVGRRYDIEIGQYYNRARYYNPYTGRFLQADPSGYGDGMNMYAYCGNNSLNYVDPSGLYYTFLDLDDDNVLKFAWFSSWGATPQIIWEGEEGEDLDDWYEWIINEEDFGEKWMKDQPGWKLSRTWSDPNHSQDWFFWRLQMLRFLDFNCQSQINQLEDAIDAGRTVEVIAHYVPGRYGYNHYRYTNNSFTIYWHPELTNIFPNADHRDWHDFPAIVGLAHEIAHGADWFYRGLGDVLRPEKYAVIQENWARWGFNQKVPGHDWVKPRTGTDRRRRDITWDEYWDKFPFFYPIDP